MQAFFSSPKFSEPVMTSDSRDTQKQGRGMALTNIFAHFMERVVCTSNVSYVTAYICQIKVNTPNCQFLSSIRGKTQGDLRIATKKCSSTRGIRS